MTTLQWIEPAGRGGVPLLLARAPAADAPVAVCVHGYGRQPLDLLEAFAPEAAARGYTLVLPLFRERGRHSRYQQLWSASRRARSDLALFDALERAADRHRFDAGRPHWFGHSGGAQFVHRLAMLNPQRVASLAVSAAGWYTWPDPDRPWPLGLAGSGDSADHARLKAFLRLAIRVWVGELDDGADDVLRDEPALTALQGPGRLERARRWVDALAARAELLGVRARPRLRTLPDCGHDFLSVHRRARLARRVFAHFDSSREGVSAPRRAAP